MGWYLFGPKVVQKRHFVNYSYVLNKRLPKPEFLKSTTSICLACWLAALCTRVPKIRGIRRSSGCTLHTCLRNTTNSEIQRLYFAHVFEEYDEFGARTAALCTRVQRIRRIRSSNGSTLHTCSNNTTNLELERQLFAYVFEVYDEFEAQATALCTRVQEIPRIPSSSDYVTSRSLPDWMAEFQSGVVPL